ncbi:MAG: Crp/Fnr family transcriptional regulator [Betaproteobacteria bacterium]|jgi:CRP-like cAMP-binding protein|nr:Crp/Fnr family transcriptional regulator [Rhodocyclales bacterium]
MDGLDDSGLTRFLRVYEPAQSIFREGDPGDVMYVVHDGLVEIHKEGEADDIAYTALGKGEFFGEMALVDQSPRFASATAGSQGARVLAIDSGHFVYLVSQQPAFALIVLQVMASRLRSNSAQREAVK